MPGRRARARAVLTGIAGLGLLAACNGPIEGGSEEASAGPPAYGDTFIQASIGDIGGLIPSLTSDQSPHEVGGLIYDGLSSEERTFSSPRAWAKAGVSLTPASNLRSRFAPALRCTSACPPT